MCRSSANGGRRCSGGASHSKAAGAARQRRYRANLAANTTDQPPTGAEQEPRPRNDIPDDQPAPPAPKRDMTPPPPSDDQPATPTPNRDVTSPPPPPDDTTPHTASGDDDDEPRVSNTTTIINHTGPISTGGEDQVNVFHNGRLTSSQTVPAGTALPPEVAEKVRNAEAVAEQAMQEMRERFAGIPTPAPGTVHVQGTVGRRITGSTEPLHVGTGKQFVQGPDGQFHEVTRD